MSAIKVPPNRSHTPAAQAIAELQKDLKRYSKQEAKSPAGWRRVKIQELEERLRGVANSKGWLVDPTDLRASTTCKPCNADLETGESDQVYPPGPKACCMTWCGVCPCAYCQDTYQLDTARQELEELQGDLDTQRDVVVAMYVQKKGLSEAAANAKIDEKLEAAKQKVKDEEGIMQDKAQEKVGSTIGFCQTLVAAPCMVGF